MEGGDGEVEEARQCGVCGGMFHAACLAGHPNAAGNMVCEGGIPGYLGGKKETARLHRQMILGADYGASSLEGKGEGWIWSVPNPADGCSAAPLAAPIEKKRVGSQQKKKRVGSCPRADPRLQP